MSCNHSTGGCLYCLQEDIQDLVLALSTLEKKIEDWAESEDSDGHTEIVNFPEMLAARKVLDRFLYVLKEKRNA